MHLDIKPANIVCFELEHTKEGHDQSGMMFVDVCCSIGLPVVECFDLQGAVEANRSGRP